MTQEQFIEIKEDYIQNMKDMLLETGNIQPMVTVIGDHLEENKPALVHIPLPGKIANSDHGKQMFVDEMIPEISKEIRKKFEIKAIAWASEAWMREGLKENYDPIVDDYKKLPIKKEILIISVDTGVETENFVYEIIRMAVSPEGDLVETIELVELPELSKKFDENSGRFGNLYTKFTKSIN
jgi:hypothetical protein